MVVQCSWNLVTTLWCSYNKSCTNIMHLLGEVWSTFHRPCIKVAYQTEQGPPPDLHTQATPSSPWCSRGNRTVGVGARLRSQRYSNVHVCRLEYSTSGVLKCSAPYILTRTRNITACKSLRVIFALFLKRKVIILCMALQEQKVMWVYKWRILSSWLYKHRR